MKTHWLSEVCYAKDERKRIRSGPWYTYAKKQANREVRRNAQYDINEGLDEIAFGPDDERAHTEWEHDGQARLMHTYQEVLGTALDFACRRSEYHDMYDDYITWCNADDEPVAEKEVCSSILIIDEHHEFVWNVFKMFF